RHAAVFENYSGSVTGSQSELIFFLPCKEARHSFLENESRDPMVACRPVCDSHRDADVAVSSMCRECLLTVQDPMIAFEVCVRLGAACVAARFGFGQAPCADLLSLCQWHNESTPLFFV